MKHHAMVCIADSLEVSAIPEEYKKQTNDTSHIICDTFGIDEARKLIHDATQKPVAETYRVFVLEIKKFSSESQNALLKLFEEPPEQTIFYLVLPQAGMLIPTLESRVLILEEQRDEEVDKVFTDFLQQSIAERMTTIENLVKNKKTQVIDTLLREAEKLASKDPVAQKQLLRCVVSIGMYSKARGASVKMLLEELALNLPQK